MNVEQERQQLIAQKQRGEFNLLDHLKNHPISGILRLVKLSKDHPLMRLKNSKS